MLFLIPPSETKSHGGSGLSISQVALTFGGLNPARDRVYSALNALCQDPQQAARVLKISAKQTDDLQQNLLAQTAPVMPAILRYSGTLYDAIHGRGLKGTPTENATLSREAISRAKEHVLIQSSLFGLIPATDLIPYYRMSASARLPKLVAEGTTLAKVWAAAHQAIWPRLQGGVLIDLRSKAYAELAPIPSDVEHYTLDVDLLKPDGTRERLNHFNKKAKGQLIHAALTAEKVPETFEDLAKLATKIGMQLERSGRQLTLVTRA